MTREQLLAKWQKAFQLGGWEIRFVDHPLDPDCRSQVDLDTIHRRAVIRLHPEMPANQVERQIVHELLHVLLSGMEDSFRQALEHTPPATDKPLERWWQRGEEWAIERLTNLLTDSIAEQWFGDEIWMKAFPPSKES